MLKGNQLFVCRLHEPLSDLMLSLSDTVPPTAYVSTSSSFTNASNASVYITFSEPCSGGGGFRCSESDCDVSMPAYHLVNPAILQESN